MKSKDKIDLKIIDIDSNGLGIAKENGKVIFVENALPDEEVLAKITDEHSKISFAKSSIVKEKNINREVPPCSLYYKCGGCNLMHMNYEYELEFKKNKVKNTLKKYALIDAVVNDTIYADNRYHYRNKVIIHFSKEGTEINAGFYKERTHDIIEIKNCLIEPLIVDDIIKELKIMLIKYSIDIYNEKTNSGLFRSIMLRVNQNKEIMLVLVATSKNEKIYSLAKEINDKYNQIISIYLNINDKKTNVVLSNNYILLFGKPFLYENILGINLEVSPASFLQVNHDQCEKLYSKAIEYACVDDKMTVIDAYSGIGSISLAIARKAKHVYGIEIVSDAVDNANKNKSLNNIDNVTFILGKCEEEIKKLVNRVNIDVILFDPPRKGCDIEFLWTVIEMKIPRIVYISCNISTCARDISLLLKNNYELVDVTPVDMFPNTAHVETITLLSLKEPKNSKN